MYKSLYTGAETVDCLRSCNKPQYMDVLIGVSICFIINTLQTKWRMVKISSICKSSPTDHDLNYFLLVYEIF